MSNQPASGSPTTPAIPPQPTSLLSLWLWWRLPAILFWLCPLVFLTKDLIPNYISSWRHLLICPAVFICIASIIKGFWHFIVKFFWFLLFPIFATVWLGKHSFGAMKIAIKTIRTVTGPIAIVLYITIELILDNRIMAANDSQFVHFASIIAIAINFAIIAVSLRWAISPIHFLKIATVRLEKFRLMVDAVKPTSDPTKKDSEANVQRTKWCKEKIDNVLVRMKHSSTAVIVTCFLIASGSLLLLTIVNYATIYSSLHRVDEKLFVGLEDDFESSFLFSISVITTSPLEAVKMTTRLEHRIYVSQLVAAVLLVTMFISMCSVGLGLQQDVIDTFRKSIDRFRTWMSQKYQAYEMRHSVPHNGQESEVINSVPPSPPATPAT